MLHHWLAATDRTGSTVRVALLDFRKAFDLVDHNLLIAKLFSYGIKPHVVNWIADFLRGRSQRVKINKECCSAFLQVPAGIPQGTKIGPWLFLLMINDLSIAGPISSRMWKFADDTTLCEVVPRDGISKLQDMVQQVEDWSSINMFQLNATKCKELRINFSKQKSDVDLVIANEQFFELVTSAKILGVTVTDDLKWNAHVNNVVLKASKRLYLLRLLKRADLDVKSLIQFYCTCIRSILEYACQTFHSSLPQYLSDDIERIQKRALRIIFPDLHYNEALESARLTTLCARREELCMKLFSSIEEDSQHKLRHLLPEPNTSCYNFRTARKYQLPQINTKRYLKSFIPFCAAQATL